MTFYKQAGQVGYYPMMLTCEKDAKMTADERQLHIDYVEAQINQIQAELLNLYAQLRGNNTPAEESVLRTKIFDKQQVVERFQKELKAT